MAKPAARPAARPAAAAAATTTTTSPVSPTTATTATAATVAAGEEHHASADDAISKLRRTRSAEDFALAFGNVELPLVGLDHMEGHEEDLADFSEYWVNPGLPPKGPGWSKQQQQQQHQHQQQQQQQQHQDHRILPQAQQSMLSGSTSPTEGDTGTQASESWAGTTAADDIVSTLSNDTDDCDTESRSSVKRRRMTGTNSSSSFLPELARVKETAATTDASDEPDVRPWKVDIPDHDVVLGDTHEPTWGTKLYREVRKPFAKKTITNEQLKHVKLEFQRRLEKELGKKLACLPRFWCNKESKSKAKQIPVSGFLKSRPGITYAYAKDQAIKDDIKNASARSRTRATKHFNLKGSLEEVAEKALEACETWVGEDIDKELYAKGFKEDVERMIPWRGEYLKQKKVSEQKATREVVMRGTHMREAKIHETHATHLEVVMIDMINQLGNMMIEAHKADSKRYKAMTVASSDTVSVEESSVGGTSSRAARSSVQETTTASRKSKQTNQSGSSSTHHHHGKGSSSSLSPKNRKQLGFDLEEMDFSPIDIRKGGLSEKLQADAAAMAAANNNNKNSSSSDHHHHHHHHHNHHRVVVRKDLASMFTQNLRMSSLDEIMMNNNNGSSQGVAAVSNSVSNVVVMPPGLPREVRPPGGPSVDELSVLSAPDDLSLLFMEARESAILRGIDQPAALPQPGHVADRTKALLQQMKQRGDNTKK